jgi:two-component system sensor histidine kinase QseC
MKLFDKYNRINIAAIIFTFIVGGIAFYLVLDYVLIAQLDRSLRVEEQEIQTYIQKNNRFPEIHDTRHQWIQKSVAVRKVTNTEPHSTIEYNPIAQISEPVRQYRFTSYVAGKFYIVTVSQSKTETEQLLRLIILITLGMTALILGLNYLISRTLVNRLWQPFYTTIGLIGRYKIASRKPLELPNVAIDEINLLNTHLNEMTERIHKDYRSLKEFTENASHEMQTPLAIIRSHVDGLLQDETMSEKSIRQLVSIEDAVGKLSKLQQALLMLAKLENRQFDEKVSIDLSEVIENWIVTFSDLFKSGGILIDTQYRKSIVSIHPYLADILVSNLLKNALRYTPKGGLVTIAMSSFYFTISNTALNESLDQDRLFSRFYKASELSDSTGLGLAIVHEICKIVGWQVSYHFSANTHFFTVQYSA